MYPKTVFFRVDNKYQEYELKPLWRFALLRRVFVDVWNIHDIPLEFEGSYPGSQDLPISIDHLNVSLKDLTTIIMLTSDKFTDVP